MDVPWSQDVERAGVIMGRLECSGIDRRDTGKDLFVRRIVHSDRGGNSTWVDIDYDRVHALQTIPTRGRRPGRLGADDFGLVIGNVHSHPGPDRVRELSDTDIRSAAWNAVNSPTALAGKPSLVAVTTAGEAWREGFPAEDWIDPILDFSLVFGDRRVVKPSVYVQGEVEWLCEEQQRSLIAAGGN